MEDELYVKVAKLRQLVIKSKERFSEELKGKLYRVLLDSEALLLEAADSDASGGRMDNPSFGYDSKGSIELGTVLYWLNNPSEEWKLLVEDVVFILLLIEGEPLPKSSMTRAVLEKLKKENIIPDFIGEEDAIYACSSIIPVSNEDIFWLVENITQLINPVPQRFTYGR